jgi:hypothetical protein
MAEDLPGPPGAGRREDQPGDRPTQPQPPEPPGAGSPPPPPPSQPYGTQPYGQPYGAPQGYGPPYGQPGYGYGYPGAPQTESSATAALVIAIVGFFICPPVAGIVALIMANNAQQRIAASEGRLTGLDQARAARIIAIVELALTALLIIGGLIAIMATLGASYS